MSIINDYIFSHIRSDKKNTIFIFITITIAAILISTLPLMYYAQHDNMINMTIDITGNVYFSITQPIPADDLHYISDHPDVAEVFTEAAKEEGMIFVNVLLKDVQKTYPVSEEICEILNLQKNVYDRYPVYYNRALIGLYGVKDPYTMKQTLLGELLQMVIPIVLLTIVLFIVIIYNVTVTTENRRIKEFGILKSVGMSPKQIRGLIICESLLYCIVAAPVGLIVGYILQGIFLYYKFSVLISIICPLLLILTVLTASFIPAYKISKLTAIEAIKGNEYAYAKKNIKMKINNLISKIFGIDGVLASNNFKFYRSMFRTTLISFSLFLTIVFAFQCFMTAWWVDSVERINQLYFDSSIFVYGDMNQNESMVKYLAATDNEYVAYHHQLLSTIVKYTDISEKFIADGGFNTKVLSGIAAVEDGWMMSVHLVGFDEKSFVNYCNEIGANPIEFNDNDVILVDNVEGGLNQNIQNYLPWEVYIGDTITINSGGEYSYGAINAESYAADVTVRYMTDTYPKQSDSTPIPYDIFIIATEETYYLLLDELNIDLTEDYSFILIKFNENNESDEELSDALSNYENSYIETRDDKTQQLNDSYDSVSSLIMALLIFFGTVGICSSYSTIAGNFNIRSKDFALLRSQGIESRRLKRILYIESFIFSIVPFAITIPITIVANIPMFMLFKYTTVESFITALPYDVIAVCVLVCVCSVVLSYIANVRQIFKHNITECIKF